MRGILVILAGLLLAAPAASAAEPGRPVGGPVSFRPAGDSLLELAGRGSFRGTLEIRPAGASVSVVNELDIEEYLLGLAEVPASWPTNALKAQAVAARTYALWEKENGAWRKSGFDVCATTTCQVYGGLTSERRENGKRWSDAVRATAGEVLLFKGQPALARYHASSGGSTLGNETVFPSTGRLPYLRAVRDPADRVSPLHSWNVFFGRDQMQAIVREAFELGGTLEDVVADEDARVVSVRSSAGERRMSTPRFRQQVSRTAPKLFPASFPGTRADGRTMPETLPSSRFTVSAGDSGFTFAGRGFGHGVGMSQWGAKGRADRGDDYREILSAYYTGLEVTKWRGPTTLRVGIVRSASTATVSGSGAFGVWSANDPLSDSTLGRWTVTRGPGRSLAVRPPAGASLPLVLSGLEVPRRVTVSGRELEAVLHVSFVVPKPARVDAVLVSGSGERIGSGRAVVESGEARVRVVIPEPRKLDARGSYEVRVSAFDGERRVTRDTTIEVVRTGADASLPIAVGVLLALLGASLELWRRRSRPGKDLEMFPPAEVPRERASASRS